MELPRRFLNLVVTNGSYFVKSVCRISLARGRGDPLFYPTSPPAAGGGGILPEPIRLPRPSVTFEPTPSEKTCAFFRTDCLPLADAKSMICLDQSARAVLVDVENRHLQTMPSLHAPKRNPISLAVPSVPGSDDVRAAVYVMERVISPELTMPPTTCSQLEALVYSKSMFYSSFFHRWECQRLPPPPFLEAVWYGQRAQPFTTIMSYAVLGGGSHVCISVEGHGAGTYCLDTATHSWSKLGDWVLPFYGKVEYVPELKLWLGFPPGDSHTLCASSGDLSAPANANASMAASCPLQLDHIGKELDPPEEWGWLPTSPEPVVVSLGSRRLCLARFFNTVRNGKVNSSGEQEEIERFFAVLTGVEVEAGNGEGGGGIRFIAHKSRRLSFTNGFQGIDAIF